LCEGNRKAALSIFKNMFVQETERIKTITQPTLIIFGEKDQLIAAENAFMFEKDIKGSKAVLIKNVGHVPMEEAPQQTATLINAFIK
jgi:pimeloyl-ACP methyl ester carboxylesterase